MKNRILLTFDLEEFDLPPEFGCPISDEEQINVTNNGLLKLTGILAKYNIPATFFTTGFYAERNRELIKSLSTTHEIASHSYYHSDFSVTDPAASRKILEEITGKQVYGFRMPRFQKIDPSIISQAGYRYDSSVHPTLIPGRYNNLFARRKYHFDIKSNLIEIPISVSPLVRFPLFWLTFKNIPLSAYLGMCNMTARYDSYLHLCFHPWEFGVLDSFKIPRYIKSLSGDRYADRFDNLVSELGKIGDFSTISDFLKSDL